MRRVFGFGLGVWLGVACGEEPASAPLIGDACDGEDTVTCAQVTASGRLDKIGVCRDGALELLLTCPGSEECTDPGIAGAVACSSGLTFIPYAVEGAECPSDGAKACDTDQVFVLVCEGGEWAHETDCSDEVQRCMVAQGSDEAMCADPT